MCLIDKVYWCFARHFSKSFTCIKPFNPTITKVSLKIIIIYFGELIILIYAKGLECIAYNKCSIHANYYYLYVTEERTETLLRLDTCSQAHSWLEAERGFELRLARSGLHTQPPRKQEKSRHLWTILLFLLALIANRNWSFNFTYEKQQSIRIKRAGSRVSLSKLKHHLHLLIVVQPWEIYLNSLCLGFLISPMGKIVSYTVAVKIEWEKPI